MVPDDVIINKSRAITPCLVRIQAEYQGDQQNLFENLTKQDAIVLNLQRACELAIDMAMPVVRLRNLGIP
jgi:hypothetical protein